MSHRPSSRLWQKEGKSEARRTPAPCTYTKAGESFLILGGQRHVWRHARPMRVSGKCCHPQLHDPQPLAVVGPWPRLKTSRERRPLPPTIVEILGDVVAVWEKGVPWDLEIVSAGCARWAAPVPVPRLQLSFVLLDAFTRRPVLEAVPWWLYNGVFCTADLLQSVTTTCVARHQPHQGDWNQDTTGESSGI